MYIFKRNVFNFNFQTQIPHFIGELDDLECLYINKNKLDYLPGCLQDRTFKHLNIRDNNFLVPSYYSSDDLNMVGPGKPTCLKLCDLSFFSLINNCVKLSRREIPFALRHLFYSFCRCRYCNALMMIDSINKTNFLYWVTTLNFAYNVIIPWQHYKCPFKCNISSHVLNN